MWVPFPSLGLEVCAFTGVVRRIKSPGPTRGPGPRGAGLGTARGEKITSEIRNEEKDKPQKQASLNNRPTPLWGYIRAWFYRSKPNYRG